ncbi:unnamed protein product [Didymodactylos carnosus]|nr:unnamed protein product [Didymodactylos carnosus]CAF4070137.1 unnamed protein product [Didymodactylos carnosus]
MAAIVNKITTTAPQIASGVARFAQPKLKRFWYFARVELRPPMPGEFGAVQQGFQNLVKSATTQGWRNLTVKQLGLNTLVGIEVICWFYIGECIGKGSIVGYRPGRAPLPAPYKYFIYDMAELNETFLVHSLRANISDGIDDHLERVEKSIKDIQSKTIVEANSTERQHRLQTPLDLAGVLRKSDEEIVFPNVIDLNVGGYHYTTSLSTLRKYEDSMLAVMFSGRYQLVRDEEGHIFIDRDGKYFG